MNSQVFIYCERGLDGGFWAEPLNALTNGAFIVAGLAVWALVSRRPTADRSIFHPILAFLIVIIGVGSFLFHTFATRWSALADVIPIGIFMLLYFVVASAWFLRLPLWGTAAATLGFIGLMWAVRTVPCTGTACMNGSIGYMPAFLALALIGGILVARGHPAGCGVLLSGALFAVSLAFRTVDRDTCGDLSIGTHSLWHLLNAVVLYGLARAAVLHRRWN